MSFRAVKALKRLRGAFYRGPDWIEMPDLRAFNGYRSPTALGAIWLAALLARILSPSGIALSGLVFACAMYSTILPKNNVTMLLFGLLSLYAVDFVAGFVFKPKLKIARETPARVKAGALFEISYKVENSRRLPAWELSFDPGLPSKALKPLSGRASLEGLSGRAKAKASVKALAQRRGVFTLPRPLAESQFPFGLFKRSCRSGSTRQLVIHPDFKEIESLRMPGGPRLQKTGITAVSKVGESMEFHGCREFRTGDDPRKMHWLGSARTGEPVVKEFQEERLNRVALLLDTHCRRPPLAKLLMNAAPDAESDVRFEAAVSLAAAIAEHLARGEFVIDLFATGTKTWRFRGGRSLAQLDDILDILACVEPSFGAPFESMDAALLEEISAIGSVIMVLTEADAKAEALCKAIEESGAGLRPLLVSAKQGPEWAERIAPSDIAEGRAVRL